MRLSRTTWSPDTCDCSVEYEFDADLPSEERVHVPVHVHRTCQFHDQIPLSMVYERVSEENRRKNRALNEVLEQLPEQAREHVKWRFDMDRELVIELPQSEKGKNLKSSHEKVRVE